MGLGTRLVFGYIYRYRLDNEFGSHMLHNITPLNLEVYDAFLKIP
jgi:hypothetical protein